MTTGAAVPALVLALLILLWIAALPRIFFRPGRWNVQWWLNTAPFGLTGLVLLGVLVGKFEPSIRATAPWDSVLASGAVVFLAASLGLMGFAMGSHRTPPALWHQDDDPPGDLVRDGPYACIRHPLYTAYLVTLAGGLLAAPHWINLAVLLFVAYRLNRTAAREEARFLRSPLAAAYGVYMRRTGRLVPWPRSEPGTEPRVHRPGRADPDGGHRRGDQHLHGGGRHAPPPASLPRTAGAGDGLVERPGDGDHAGGVLPRSGSPQLFASSSSRSL